MSENARWGLWAVACILVFAVDGWSRAAIRRIAWRFLVSVQDALGASLGQCVFSECGSVVSRSTGWAAQGVLVRPELALWLAAW